MSDHHFEQLGAAIFEAATELGDQRLSGPHADCTHTERSRELLAMVQSAWSVYMALPSPTNAMTFLSGHAIAAPTAQGIAMPVAPPVRER
jgi:hypothetical protein